MTVELIYRWRGGTHGRPEKDQSRGGIYKYTMYVFRLITSFLIIGFMSIVGFFLAHSKRDSASVIGFTAMELVYLMALIGIWG